MLTQTDGNYKHILLAKLIRNNQAKQINNKKHRREMESYIENQRLFFKYQKKTDNRSVGGINWSSLRLSCYIKAPERILEAAHFQLRRDLRFVFMFIVLKTSEIVQKFGLEMSSHTHRDNVLALHRGGCWAMLTSLSRCVVICLRG